jgi:hypothetical protein
MAHVAHGLFILVIVLAALVGPAQAAPRRLAAPANSITVNSLLDPAPIEKCGLRDAIIAANSHASFHGCPAGAPGLDTINFGLFFCPIGGCVIHLNGTLPAVIEDLTINGSGMHISGENLYQVFDLGAVPVTIANLSITNGKADTGGGIRTNGTTLTVDHVVFSGNNAVKGAAIGQGNGTLFVYNSVFSGNSGRFGGAFRQVGGSATISDTTFSANSGELGGALGVFSPSSLQVIHSVFDGNTASVGGAIDMEGVGGMIQATITATTFTNNQALTTTATFGGGALSLNQASLTLADSTLANNSSQSEAGGLGLFGGQATLTNVTLSANTARRDGGGLRAANDGVDDLATLNLNNVTITGNTADSDNNDNGNGGGIDAASGTVNIQNSILAGNFDTPGNSSAGTVHPDCSATLASASHNLIGINAGCAGIANGSNGNHMGTIGGPLDPRLGPLADNGGPTLTQALLSDSPALNAGHPLAPGTGGLACAAADQRGVARPLGIHCDLGAYEAGMRVFLSLLRR